MYAGFKYLLYSCIGAILGINCIWGRGEEKKEKISFAIKHWAVLVLCTYYISMLAVMSRNEVMQHQVCYPNGACEGCMALGAGGVGTGHTFNVLIGNREYALQ